MASRLKTLAKDSVVYGLSSVISKMITIFLVPVYTRIFNPEDYGVINIVNTTFFLISLFCVLGLDSSAARWFYDTNDESDKKSTISTWFWFQLFISFFFGLALLFFTPLASKYLFQKSLNESWILWLLPCSMLITNILPRIITNWFRYMLKPISNLLFTISQSIFTIGLTIYLVVYLKIGLTGVFLALFISSFVFSVISVFIMKSWINIRYFQRDRLIAMLKYAFPLVPAALAYWVLSTTNSYFLLFLKDQKEVGLFAIGTSIASGVMLFTGAFQQAWGPFAYSIHKEPDAKKTYADVFFAFGIISSVIILFMFLFTPELLLLLTTKDYYEADWVASILSVNLILVAFTYIASIGPGIVKDNKPYAKAVFIGAFITVILNVLFIPVFGKNGSAVATLLAQSVVTIYIFYYAHKLYPIPYNFKGVFILILVSIFIGTVGKLFSINLFSPLIWKCFIFIIYVSVLYFLSVKKLKNILKTIKPNV